MNPLPDAAPRLVVVDAGHGGNDPGARALDGTKESDLTLLVANALVLELAALGHKAERTREKDVGLSLHDRATFANQHHAACFVSVHLNASLNTTARGVWVLHAAGSGLGKALAKSIHAALCPGQPERVYPDASPWTNKRSLYVLRHTVAPAALVECGFLSNPSELAEIQQPDWPQKTAHRIAQGVHAWLDPKPKVAA